MNEFARFANDLARAATGLDLQANAAAERVGRAAFVAASRYVPVDSGDLRRSLRFRRQGSRAVIESDLYYSTFQEFGTSQMAPQPFVGPAADQYGPQLALEVERIGDGVVKKL